MKKISGILTVSLVAVMAVGAARAELAATTYVDEAVEAATANMEVTTNKITDTEGYNTDIASTSKYPSMAVANEIAKSAASSAVASKVNTNQGTAHANKVLTVNAQGVVTNNKIVNANIADGAAIATSKIAGLDSALNAKEASANKTNTYSATATDKATKFPTVSAAEAIADAKVKPVADRVTTAEGNITTLQTNVTNLTQNLDTTINNKIDTALGENGAISEVLADYATNAALNTVRTTANAADSLSKTNKTAIEGINNGTTGILAQAKADATTKANAAQAAAKTYTDSLADNYATAAQGAKADTAVQPATLTTELAKKQNKLTAGTNISINAETNTISATGLASASDLTTLTTRVSTAEGDIDTLQDTVSNATTGLVKKVADNTASINTLKGADTVAGSVANTVKTKIDGLDVTATTGTGVIGSISQTDGKVAATYKTITNADVAADAKIAQSKIDGLTTALAGKQEKGNYIQVPAADPSVKGTQVLTFDGTTYYWETIGR